MAFTRGDLTTFDHVCENCGTTLTNVPHATPRLVDLIGGMQPGGYTIVIDCPNCPTSESLNTALTADDENFGPLRRRLQARIIRRIQQARGLPML